MVVDTRAPRAAKVGRRVAFLIGNARFSEAPDLTPLAGPPNDVRRLGEVFRDPEVGGYEVHTFVDRRSNEVLPEIEEKVAELGREDLVVVYYSGHGRLDRAGRLCLASADTRSNAIVNTSIRVRALTDLLYQSNVGNTVLLLDCCFSGAAGQDLRGTINDELATQTAVGHHVFTSSTDTEVSREEVDHESGEKLGAFTARLIQGMVSGEADTDDDGAISLQELRTYVQSSLQRQKPQYWGSATFRDPTIALSHAHSEQVRMARLDEKLRAWVTDKALDPATYAHLLKVLHHPETERDVRGKEILLRLAETDDFTADVLQLTWAGYTGANRQGSARAPFHGAGRAEKQPAAPPPEPRVQEPTVPIEPKITAAAPSRLSDGRTSAGPEGRRPDHRSWQVGAFIRRHRLPFGVALAGGFAILKLGTATRTPSVPEDPELAGLVKTAVAATRNASPIDNNGGAIRAPLVRSATVQPQKTKPRAGGPVAEETTAPPPRNVSPAAGEGSSASADAPSRSDSTDRQMAHALALRGWGFDTLGDYQEAKRLYERALALEPFDTVAFSGLLGILHDREFDFPASFQHAKRWLDRFPNDTSRVIEVVEAMVTLGGPKPLAVIDALRNWRLPLERRMVVNALELVALAAVGDESALRQRKYELLELAMAAPPNMNYHWSFRGTLHYLSGLTTPHCGCISRVLTGIERNDQRMIVDALR